jgi:quercetin dioxygenase-like cupin family protein
MKVFRNADATPRQADAQSFTGSATTKLLASDQEGETVHLYRVAFESGGRTNWHTHSGPQWLLVVEGAIRVQRWGEKPIDVAAGDAVVFPPGEKHWHGAVPGQRGTHVAVNVNVTTEWLEPVSDQDYSAS